MDAWQVYSATEAQPWNSYRVAHLHRRALFGGTWEEHQRDLRGTPRDAIDRVICGKFRISGVSARFEQVADAIGTSAEFQPDSFRLKAWWMYRILYTHDPLQERLTLLWHNHFATSNLKVNNLPFMRRQNDTLRSHARGKFGELLHAMMRDPALLYWLDAPSNRYGRPNENLGREAMELFTLGIGNYTESDVKNAARALTGLSVKQQNFKFDSLRHDAGSKSILGRTGNFDPDDFVDLLVEHPATARRIAGKLISEFFAEGVVNQQATEQLANLLRQSGLDIGKAVETILRSELFFSDSNINSRICDPVSFIAIPLRALNLIENTPATFQLGRWLSRMGLDLFYPPNVAGWRGGRAWLTTRTVIARANFAAELVSGKIYRPAKIPDFRGMREQAGDIPVRQMLETLLVGGPPSGSSKKGPGSTESGETNMIVRLLSGTSANLH